MRFINNVLGLLTLTSALTGALAAPISEPSTTTALSKRYVTDKLTGRQDVGGKKPDETDYDSDDAIRAAYDSVGPKGPTVFFSTIGDTRIAEDFAGKVGGFIFRGAYPDGYTKRGKHTKAWYQNFADRFSGVLAEKASGEAFVVAPFNDDIADCKVWVRVEFPTLKENSAVTKVTLVNFENFDETKIIYDRAAKMLARSDSAVSFNKRDDFCPEDWVLAEQEEGESDSESDSDDE